MLAERVQVVIGVDTHRDTHTAAVVVAVRAAREVLTREHLASPRAEGPRAVVAVRMTARRCAVEAHTITQRQLQSLVTTAPDGSGSGSLASGRRSWLQPRHGCGSMPVGISRPATTQAPLDDL